MTCASVSHTPNQAKPYRCASLISWSLLNCFGLPSGIPARSVTLIKSCGLCILPVQQPQFLMTRAVAATGTPSRHGLPAAATFTIRSTRSTRRA